MTPTENLTLFQKQALAQALAIFAYGNTGLSPDEPLTLGNVLDDFMPFQIDDETRAAARAISFRPLHEIQCHIIPELALDIAFHIPKPLNPGYVVKHPAYRR